MAYYIGIMSGTSIDGIDAVLLSIEQHERQIVATQTLPFPVELQHSLNWLCSNSDVTVMGQADRQLAHCYAKCVTLLLQQAQVSAQQITAIGCHGQTIHHAPPSKTQANDTAFTLQIGDPHTLASSTGIDVVSDFRRKDIALGGQGAPLVPAFHAAAFGCASQSRAVVNIGGIANVTLLPKDASRSILGSDTGPGNTLLDHWYRKFHNDSFDHNGQWAATGTVSQPLLETLLSDDYFHRNLPKSTGREYFNIEWLASYLESFVSLSPVDVQATLTQLTANSIAQSIQQHDVQAVYVCGGGAFNATLLAALQAQLPQLQVATTAELGLAPQWVEAAAFAWLAHAYYHKLPGNVPSVTGASRPAVLGTLTLAD